MKRRPMMKIVASTLLFSTLALPSSVSAERFSLICSGSNAVPHFSSNTDNIIRNVQELHDFYMSAPEEEAGNGCVERTNNRNRAIKKIFDDIATERRTLYTAWSCKQVDREHTCSGSRGRTRKCHFEYPVPAGQQIIGKYSTSGAFRGQPSFQNGVWYGQMRKSGRGKVRGYWSGETKYTTAHIAQQIKKELDPIRKAVEQAGFPSDRTLNDPRYIPCAQE